jgi:hypothetical protein
MNLNKGLMAGLAMAAMAGSLMGAPPMTARGRNFSVAPVKASKQKRKFKGSKAAKKASRLHR